MPLLHRITRADHPAIAFTLDGEPCEGRAGDTVLTAILTQAERLRLSEFSASPRAGFCQMGACQDCWVVLESGERLRACSTALTAGMRILTRRARTA
jgi:predicted molibdopterin-dependent oxidoreductase YjgC